MAPEEMGDKGDKGENKFILYPSYFVTLPITLPQWQAYRSFLLRQSYWEHVTFASCSDSNQAIEVGSGVEPVPVAHFPASTVRRKSLVAGLFV